MTFRVSAFSRRSRLVAASLAVAAGLFAGTAQAAPAGAGLAGQTAPIITLAHDDGYGYGGGRHRGGDRGWGGGRGGWDHHRGRGDERRGWGRGRGDWGHHHHHRHGFYRGYDRY